jgi:fumarate reductase subunit D
MNRFSADSADSGRNNLYGIGGVAALICATMYVIALGVYVPANRAGPPPATVLEWFTLFQTSPLTGLFFLGLADIVIMILWGPLALAIYDALKQSGETWARVAVSFAFVGMAVYLATNTAFSMLSLSHKYAAAATEAEETITLAAGQALISVSEGTGAQYTGMPLVWLAGLVLSALMLRSKAFSKATAWVGILGLGLLVASMPFAGYTTTGTTTAAVGAIVAVTYVGGGLLSLAWYILVGVRLLKLRRIERKSHAQQS